VTQWVTFSIGLFYHKQCKKERKENWSYLPQSKHLYSHQDGKLAILTDTSGSRFSYKGLHLRQ